MCVCARVSAYSLLRTYLVNFRIDIVKLRKDLVDGAVAVAILVVLVHSVVQQHLPQSTYQLVLESQLPNKSVNLVF